MRAALLVDGALARAPPARAVIAAFGQKFESQRARDRRGLDEPHRDAITEAVGLAALSADQGMAGLVGAGIVGADGARGGESVRAGVVGLDGQAGAGGARNVGLVGWADAIGEEMGEQAVEGLAFGLHGAALGGRDLCADLAERGGILLLRQCAVTEPQGANEAAMNDEVGITADRRGEMGVAAQVEAEMPVVLGGIFGLRLPAQ